LEKWAWAKLNKSLKFDSNICASVLAMMGLAFLSGTLNGSDILNMHQFSMKIVWLVGGIFNPTPRTMTYLVGQGGYFQKLSLDSEIWHGLTKIESLETKILLLATLSLSELGIAYFH
jgi:hypothetical protein